MYNLTLSFVARVVIFRDIKFHADILQPILKSKSFKLKMFRINNLFCGLYQFLRRSTVLCALMYAARVYMMVLIKYLLTRKMYFVI